MYMHSTLLTLAFIVSLPQVPSPPGVSAEVRIAGLTGCQTDVSVGRVKVPIGSYHPTILYVCGYTYIYIYTNMCIHIYIYIYIYVVFAIFQISKMV